jgi:PAS domain S-box-containing protein
MNSIRVKILLWFFLLIIFQFITLTIINTTYYNKRTQVDKMVTNIHLLHNDLLKVINLNSAFFRNEINNADYFKSAQSNYINHHKDLVEKIQQNLAQIKLQYEQNGLNVINEIDTLIIELSSFDSLFINISQLLIQRGYKDYGFEGEMRKYAHALERLPKIDNEYVLSLRRHEKDYLLRNEEEYVNKLNDLAIQIRNQFRFASLSKSEKDSILIYLDKYQQLFNKIVFLDKKIGIRGNVGIKKQLDMSANTLETNINSIIAQVNIRKETIMAHLRVTYILFLIFSIFISALLSSVLAKKLTNPLRILSRHIADFVDNDFKQNNKLKFNRVTREIANINKQFNSMAESIHLRELQRNEAVLSLSAERKRYREMAELLPLSVFETNSDGLLSFVNNTWLSKFRYETSKWSYVNLDSLLADEKALTHIKAKKSVETFEFKAKRADGTVFPALLYMNVIKTGKNTGGYRGIIVDITERVKYIQALQREKERAEESDRLKTAFLANVSHELRTPMNGILGFSELLVNQFERNTEADMFINQIQESGAMLLNLIDDIIDLAKIESGKLEISNRETNFDKVMRDTYIHYSNYVRQHKPEVEFSLVKETDEPLHLFTDERRIKQVLINLINNAIKFTQKGKIEVLYSATNGVLRISVKDSGIGIESSKQGIVFDRFRQADDSISRNFGGTGLGLAISKQIIELMGGKITVKSQENVGSTFTFTFPYIPSSDSQQSLISVKNPNFDFSSYTILVAEDDDPSYKLMHSIISVTGAKVLRATNGREAVELYKNNSVDIILMDLNMPLLNGLEATKEIKQLNNNVPIIVQTAYAMSTEQEEAQRAGAEDFIPKPLDKNRLLEKINYWLLKQSKHALLSELS